MWTFRWMISQGKLFFHIRTFSSNVPAVKQKNWPNLRAWRHVPCSTPYLCEGQNVLPQQFFAVIKSFSIRFSRCWNARLHEKDIEWSVRLLCDLVQVGWGVAVSSWNHSQVILGRTGFMCRTWCSRVDGRLASYKTDYFEQAVFFSSIRYKHYRETTLMLCVCNRSLLQWVCSIPMRKLVPPIGRIHLFFEVGFRDCRFFLATHTYIVNRVVTGNRVIIYAERPLML